MTKPKYRTPEHRAQRQMWTPIVRSGEAWCAEVVCLEERDGGSRWIAPDSPWDVAHDATGTEYRGPSHSRCNRSEGAARGNRQRAGLGAARWSL